MTNSTLAPPGRWLFIRGITTAAVRLGDRTVCDELLTELEPITGACGVNGALVCFMGQQRALGRPAGRGTGCRPLLYRS